jgi:N-formylglutamate amidohydrolase
MKKIITHIPHSSSFIPEFEHYVISKEKVISEVILLTDWYTDDLFHSNNSIPVIADFNRVFCDVERFEDDKLEMLSEFGMGVLYTKTDNGELMRDLTNDYREKIINRYYRKHHDSFTSTVKKQLSENGMAMILDCHSFSDVPFKRDLNQNSNRPDFCIGSDIYHTPQNLIDISIEFFNSKGYSLELNNPYSGSIVPSEFYQSNNNVKSIMLEINRKLYLKPNSIEKSENYFKIKGITNEYIDLIYSKI